MGKVSIFYTNDNFGRASSITLDAGIKPCFIVKIGDLFNNENQNANGVIITNFDIKKAENISVTPTLGTQLFLYVGGESAWNITIQGIALLTCKGQDGYDNIIKWYNEHNVKDSGQAMDLTLGKQLYKGYLHQFHIQSEYKLTNCFSFTASFVGVLGE